MSKLFETVDNFFDSHFSSEEVFEKCSECGEYDYMLEGEHICSACKRHLNEANGFDGLTAAQKVFKTHFTDEDFQEEMNKDSEEQFQDAFNYLKDVEIEWINSFEGDTRIEFANSTIDEFNDLKNEYPEHADEIDAAIAKAKEVAGITEADISIDTDLEATHSDATKVENYLIDVLSGINKDYNLDNIELWITDKGNIWVKGTDGKDIVTLDRSNFTDSDIDDLKVKGYFDSYMSETNDDLNESDATQTTIDLMKVQSQIRKLLYSIDTDEDFEAVSGMLMSTIEEIGKQRNIKPVEESEELIEDEVPASQLDFKHEQLAKVQSDIEVIAELKAEDTSNELYTDLLDAYDKVVEILSDAISEDPVGTVVGSDKEETGLTIDADDSKVNIDIDDTNEEIPSEEIPDEEFEEI